MVYTVQTAPLGFIRPDAQSCCGVRTNEIQSHPGNKDMTVHSVDNTLCMFKGKHPSCPTIHEIDIVRVVWLVCVML